MNLICFWVSADGRFRYLASVGYREAKSPRLNNCLLIVQKVRVGVPSETQN